VEPGLLPFFQGHADAIPLYEALEQRVLREIPGVTVKGKKTQISFYNRHLFACASFARIRKKKDCPPVFLTVTFGLNRRVDAPRIAAAVEPYPGRWTHHLLVSHVSEIDEELMDWLREASRFSDAKR